MLQRAGVLHMPSAVIGPFYMPSPLVLLSDMPLPWWRTQESQVYGYFTPFLNISSPITSALLVLHPLHGPDQYHPMSLWHICGSDWRANPPGVHSAPSRARVRIWDAMELHRHSYISSNRIGSTSYFVARHHWEPPTPSCLTSIGCGASSLLTSTSDKSSSIFIVTPRWLHQLLLSGLGGACHSMRTLWISKGKKILWTCWPNLTWKWGAGSVLGNL